MRTRVEAYHLTCYASTEVLGIACSCYPYQVHPDTGYTAECSSMRAPFMGLPTAHCTPAVNPYRGSPCTGSTACYASTEVLGIASLPGLPIAWQASQAVVWYCWHSLQYPGTVELHCTCMAVARTWVYWVYGSDPGHLHVRRLHCHAPGAGLATQWLAGQQHHQWYW